jgi:hypothetical protein
VKEVSLRAFIDALLVMVSDLGRNTPVAGFGIVTRFAVARTVST